MKRVCPPPRAFAACAPTSHPFLLQEFGLAGTLSFILWEWAFWLIGGGGAVAAYVQATGHMPDLSNKEELAATGGSAFAFINVARLAVPVRIGLAVSTAPWVEENVVMKFGLKGNDDDTDTDE